MTTIRFASVVSVTCAVLSVAGCSSNSNNPSNPSSATGGAQSTGGTASAAGETSVAGDTSIAGSSNGGASNGGASNGGASATCTTGQKQCSKQGVPQTCASGAWQDATACTGLNYCSAGDCVPCGGTGGPTMVVSPEVGFCIDSTEVTRSQYKAWLDTTPSTSSQPATCTWNTTFTPTDENWPPTDAQDGTPVRGVDWCDAVAYCSAVGKRLCGKAGGGSNPFTDWKENTSEWMVACSSKGRYKAYPYGTNFSKTACNTESNNLMDTVVTGSLDTCQSGIAMYTGVFDMSGNVQEWEDSCDESDTSAAPDNVRCRLRGGSFLSSFDKAQCIADFYSFRGYSSWDIGFRCCSK